MRGHTWNPGTGSYLFQLAAAGLLAAMYTIRGYVQAGVALIRGKLGYAGTESPPSPDEMD